MLQPRRTFIRQAILSVLVAVSALAQTSTLSQIQDTVTTPSGSPFNGMVVITWTGTASTSGTAPFNTTVKIANGVLSVLLAPSTNITPVAYYQAVYNSSDGLTTWTETWAVPPSATPLTLNQVRVTSTGTGSGSSGGSGNGGTISGQVQINQVIGLPSDLDAINSSLLDFNNLAQGLNALIAGLSNTVTSLSNQVGSITSGSTNANFVDGEIPGGTLNGTNTVFTLANTPAISTDVTLYRNGVLQMNGTDFTMSGSTITFASSEAPQSADELVAYYRISGTGPAATFVDGESPSGSIDGTNLTFSLANTPNPTASVKLFKNGALLEQGVDYTLSGQTITFASTQATPSAGDGLVAYYRITSQTPGISVSQDVSVPAQAGHSNRQQ